METQELELSTTSILSLFQTNKSQRQTFVAGIMDALDNGTANPLHVHLQIKSMEDIVKQLNEDKKYKDLLFTAFKEQAGGQRNFEYYSAKFEQKEVGTKYDYSQCGDPVLQMLEQQAKSAAEALKARQEFLKTVNPKGLEIANEDELITVFPPSKSSTTSVSVTLK